MPNEISSTLSGLLVFVIRCSLTTEEVKDFYWRGGPEAHESTDIVFLSRGVRHIALLNAKHQIINF